MTDTTTDTRKATTTTETTSTGGEFLVTKESRRFAEFCDAVRREGYIGLCYGPPGVGKTISARHYTNWDTLQPLLDTLDLSTTAGTTATLARAVFYTPTVTATPRRLDRDLTHASAWLSYVIDQADDDLPTGHITPAGGNVELVVVDEADRLDTTCLEQLRDHVDRTGIGLVLIGMPGIEKRLARYPQLYSRIGFAHRYRPLSDDELAFVLTHHYDRLGLTLNLDDFTDHEAIAAIARITGGNFRLIQRLFTQITRILDINDLTLITVEVVDTARDALVIGPP